MSASNQVTICGNLTRDPELRFLASGTPLVSFGVAHNHRYKSGDDWKETTSFFDCTVWRDQAENIAESFSKGDRVILTGRLEQRSWETDDGDKRSKVEITVDEIGPSLRWATAVVTKVSGSGASPKADDAVPETVYADAEEPF